VRARACKFANALERLLSGVHHGVEVGVTRGQAWDGDVGSCGVPFGGGSADLDAEGGLLALDLLQVGRILWARDS
jgi:hypothetical protein